MSNATQWLEMIIAAVAGENGYVIVTDNEEIFRGASDR